MPHRGTSPRLPAPLRRRAQGFIRAGIVGVCALVSACAPPPSTKRPEAPRARLTASALIVGGRQRGLPLSNPLDLEPELLRSTRDKLGTWGAPIERLRRLIAFINDVDGGGFEYSSNLSLSASEAYRRRRGDCMAYANLFVSLARGIGLPVYFVHVSEVLSHYELGGQFFTSSHVAVGYGSGPSSVVIDFTKENRDWKLAVYRTIDDAAAVALYYNNLAVDAMLAGRLDEAQALLEYLIDAEPKIEEIYNNLGVLLNRRRRYKDALAVLQRGIRLSPEYKPFFTNGMVAARGAGLDDIARELENRGQAIAEANPYFIFARGMGLYQSADYARAAEELARAASAKPDSAVIYAWLTRAWMSAGDRERGRRAFDEARRLSPNSALLRDLAAQFPELDGALSGEHQ